MCTALRLNTNDTYFGRNLDLDMSYGEEVCVVPKYYPFEFRNMGKNNRHYAFVGMATVVNEIPLFYDGVNEHGLFAAGLNFPNNAHYFPFAEGKDNICSFELISWVLCQCKNVSDARELLEKTNICYEPFAENVPNSSLHWIISDRNESIVIESMADGLHIYENPTGILTNNPPFSHHLENLEKYKALTADNGGKTISPQDFCQGYGALGLPGDLTSKSRFVRAYFGVKNSSCESDESSSVSQVLHLLGSVAMIKGNCITDKNILDYTVYSACINADKGLYYYTTYNNPTPTCIDMHHEFLTGNTVNRFPLIWKQNIQEQN